MKRNTLSLISLMLITLKSAASIVIEFKEEGTKSDLKINVGESQQKKSNDSIDKNSKKSNPYNDLQIKNKIKIKKVSASSETGSKTITGTGG